MTKIADIIGTETIADKEQADQIMVRETNRPGAGSVSPSSGMAK